MDLYPAGHVVADHGAEGALEQHALHNAANMLKTDKGETLQLKMGRSVPGPPESLCSERGGARRLAFPNLRDVSYALQNS